MQYALELAAIGAAKQEVPVGAVLVSDHDQKIIGAAYNQPITTCDPTAHAEILALRQAGQTMKNYRLLDTTLYVTLEPCAMCAGALIHARVKRVIFATADTRNGPRANHTVIYEQGLLAEPCAKMLREFFQQRRY